MAIDFKPKTISATPASGGIQFTPKANIVSDFNANLDKPKTDDTLQRAADISGASLVSGAIKGAGSTAYSVPQAIGSVIQAYTAPKIESSITQANITLNDSINSMLTQRRKFDPSSKEYKQLDDMIKGSIDSANINKSEKERLLGNVSAVSYDSKPDILKPKGFMEKTGYLAESAAELLGPTKVAAYARDLSKIPKDIRSIISVLDESKAIEAKLPLTSTQKKTLDIIKGTEDTMTKGERLASESRMKATKLGGKEFTASPEETRAAKILEGKMTKNPVIDKEIIKKEISTRGQEAETYLEANKKPITNKEHADMFAVARKEAEKSLTPTELKAYDEAVTMFSKQLQGKGGYNTESYYKALKDFEANVADKLPRGREALIDPTGVANAKLHAASDVRQVVRDMIASKNPEFKSKMFDLASLYNVKNTAVTKAEQLTGNVFTRALSSTPAKVIGGVIAGGTAVEGFRKITGNK